MHRTIIEHLKAGDFGLGRMLGNEDVTLAALLK
jgi:hypothetical protein